MARIQINLELDSNIDAELLSKLTVALGGNQIITAPSVAFVAESLPKNTTEAAQIEPQKTDTIDKVKDETEEENFRDVSDYSEEELKSIPNDELKSIATELGIDWASAEGKNTNAKLAKLILRLQDTPDEVTENNSDEDISEEPKKSTSQDVTLDELKVELGAKVDANREAIVERLNDLGATKLTNLEESHFSAFMDFLKSL